MSRTGFTILACLALAAPALADGYTIFPGIPVSKTLVAAAIDEYETVVTFQTQGFSNFSFASVTEKKTASSAGFIPTDTVNYYGLIVLPKVEDILDQLVKIVAIWTSDDDPDEGEFALAPLTPDIVLQDASLLTWNNVEYPSTFSLITNVNQLPTSIDLGYGEIAYDWQLPTWFSAEQLDPAYAGRYYMIETIGRVGDIVPEPTTVALLSLGGACAVNRARRARS